MQSERLDVPMNTKTDRLKSIYRAYFDKVPLQFYNREPKTAFSTANIGMGLKKFDKVRAADIIHLHWVHDGYIGFRDLEYLALLNKRVYINMHDNWWLSGGCHVTHGCDKWMNYCGACPQLNSQRVNDLSRNIFRKKREVLKKIKPTIICASWWMYERARLSPIYEGFEIVRIPYCIDLERYQPIAKETARTKMNLPMKKKLVLFGSVDINDPNKGYQYFKEAINGLAGDEIEIVLFGNIRDADLGLNKKVNYLGLLKDDYSLACAYSAADVFVAPSLEDNFPNTVLESIACGTPVTAFNIGGMPDMISHSKNGFLAEVKNNSQLSQGILECLNDTGNMCTFARKKAEDEFSFSKVSAAYASLYQ